MKLAWRSDKIKVHAYSLLNHLINLRVPFSFEICTVFLREYLSLLSSSCHGDTLRWGTTKMLYVVMIKRVKKEEFGRVYLDLLNSDFICEFSFLTFFMSFSTWLCRRGLINKFVNFRQWPAFRGRETEWNTFQCTNMQWINRIK